VDHDLIFPSKSGTPMDPSNLRLDFTRVLRQAGLPKIRFHDLRHTAASLMLNHGIPVIVVSKILGHSKPSITMDIYGHLYNELQDEAAQLMDEIVTPVQVELTNERVIARSQQATKQSPHDKAEIASPGKERRVRNDRAP